MTAAAARLPAEWEPQAGVMLTWPHAAGDWGDVLDRVLPVFAAIGAAAARRAPLLVVCGSATEADKARQALRDAGAPPGNVLCAIAPSNDTWARDHGPLTTLGSAGPTLNDFTFNGWGGKFDAALDNRITGALHRLGAFGATAIQTRAMVLEGGAIETDGAGTLLATRTSVVTDTRNPGLSEPEIEARLRDWLGLERFLWLDHGDISGDDTDGHIDTLARFADPDTILYATAPEDDADHPALHAMAQQLAGFETRDGHPYRLLPLPFPGVHVDPDGRRLPATYANFLVINGAVLMPVYGVANDASAIETVGLAFPGRDVVPIDCRPIIAQNGSLHCLTMQFPRGVALHDWVEAQG